MFRQILIAGMVLACITGMFIGCSKKSNPVSVDPNLKAPSAGDSLVFSEGFEGSLVDSNWDSLFMLNINQFYPRMRITTAAAYSGTHSLTSDSNWTALCHEQFPRLEFDARDTIVGIQFYLMAKTTDSINFTVEMGQNAGSSGGLSKRFGFGFDTSNVVKATYYDTDLPLGEADTLLGQIQLNHWYKCRVEINLNTNATDSTKGVVYYLDGSRVYGIPTPTDLFGIDRLLVFRGFAATGVDGSKPYYVDDIVLYKK